MVSVGPITYQLYILLDVGRQQETCHEIIIYSCCVKYILEHHLAFVAPFSWGTLSVLQWMSVVDQPMQFYSLPSKSDFWKRFNISYCFILNQSCFKSLSLHVYYMCAWCNGYCWSYSIVVMSMKRRAMFTYPSDSAHCHYIDYSGYTCVHIIYRGGTQLRTVPETNHSWPSACYNAHLYPTAFRVVMQNLVNIIE